MFKTVRRLIWGPKDESVFYFHDGKRKRSADPIEIERSLMATLGEDWRDKIADMAKPLPAGAIGGDAAKVREDRESFRSKLLYAIDTAFGVEPYKDGVGLTEIRRLALLEGYTRFCIDLINLTAPFQKPQSRASPGPEPSPAVSGSGST